MRFLISLQHLVRFSREKLHNYKICRCLMEKVKHRISGNSKFEARKVDLWIKGLNYLLLFVIDRLIFHITNLTFFRGFFWHCRAILHSALNLVITVLIIVILGGLLGHDCILLVLYKSSALLVVFLK